MAAPPIPVKPYSRQFILDKLVHWRERRAQAVDPIAWDHATIEIDKWLDELSAWHSR